MELIPFKPGEERPQIVFPQKKCKSIKVIKFKTEDSETEKELSPAEQAPSDEKPSASQQKEEAGFEIINSSPQEEKKNSSEKTSEKMITEKNPPPKHNLAALKKASSELRQIIDKYDGMKPEEISINTKLAAQAADLSNIIETLDKQVEEKKQELADQIRAYKRAGEEMRGPRKNDEAIAWYYISSKHNCRHPMKDKPSPSGGPVKYILPSDDRGQKEKKILKPDVERLEKEYKELTEKYSSYKQRYQKLKKDYKSYLEQKHEKILRQIKETENKSASAEAASENKS